MRVLLLLVLIVISANVAHALPQPVTETSVTSIPLSQLFLFSNADEANHYLTLDSDKKYPEVINLLQSIKTKKTSPLAQSGLSFLIGLAQLNNHDALSAETSFKESLSLSSQLSELTGLYLAKSLSQQGKFNEAYKVLPPATQLGRTLDDDLFWEKIETLIALKDQTTLPTLNIRKKEKAKDEDELIKIKYYEGKYQWALANTKNALAIWKNILLSNPGSPFEEYIFETLLKNNITVESFLNDDDWLIRAKAFMEKNMAYRALPLYEKLVLKRPSLDIAHAESAFKSRNYRRAAELYQKLWDKPKAGQDRNEILNRLASSYGRSDQFDEAIRYNKIKLKMNENDDSPESAPGKLAFLYFDRGDYKKAKQAYENLIKGAGGKNLEGFLWKHFWCSYLTGDYKDALSNILQLEKMAGDKDEKAKVQYWTAKIFDLTGKKNEALQIYRHLAQEFNTDYYGILSQKIIDSGFNHSLFQISPSSGSIISIYNTLNFSTQTPFPSDDSLVLAILYAQMGLLNYAKDESERSAFFNSQTGMENIPYFLLTQNYTKMHSVGATLVKVNRESFGTKAWQLSYPRAFQFWVMNESKKQDVSSFLIWAIMRQESAFRPKIVSPADAIGLMQIIPQTGGELAKELGDYSFHHDDLKDPFTNIRFGTRYIKDRLTEFKNMPYAIASYNAGPDAVNRWKKWGDKMAYDEFIELIPYGETNTYVKKVLRNYWIYKKLYGK